MLAGAGFPFVHNEPLCVRKNLPEAVGSTVRNNNCSTFLNAFLVPQGTYWTSHVSTKNI